jgi:hypothetical protein
MHDLNFKKIENILQLIVASYPGGIRSKMSLRYTRHFMSFSLPRTG